METTTGIIALLTLAWLIVRLFTIGKREKGLPPGPPTIPVFGNLHVFPTEFAHFRSVPACISCMLVQRSCKIHRVGTRVWRRNFREFPVPFSRLERSLTHSQLKIGPGTTIVLTSATAVKEFMDKRSGNTVDRPISHMSEIVQRNYNMALSRYGTQFSFLLII